MSKITRRRFVQSSLAATAAVAVAPRFGRAQSANEKFGVAVIGGGGRGGEHIG